MQPSESKNIESGSLEERVLREISDSDVVEFLRRLVRIPTVNPPGDVAEAVACCREVLESVGFDCRVVELHPRKPNLIAELEGGNGPTLCLNAHLDVVPVGDIAAWTVDPFAAEIVDGRVFGRGALDDKASVAAQVMAGVAIARSGIPLHGRLVINAVADEEIGGPAGAALIVDGRHIVPDYVIVGEPTLNRVCLGERGGGLVTIDVHGRTAHGALPWEGANAIEAMALVIAALKSRLWPRLEKRTHPFFEHSSASVNEIGGGIKDNVVPDHCFAAIDRRFIPGEDPAECLAEMNEIAREAVLALPGIRVDVQYRGEVNKARMSAPDSPVVRAMQNANGLLGESPVLTGFSMATDGRFFAAAGYPTIIYGPGDPRLAHVPNESIGIAELLTATRAYALAAVELLTRTGER